jgi:transposase, IS6 family
MLVDWPNSIITGATLTKSNPFQWRHYESEIILLCARWRLRYSLSYSDLEEMMRERGLSVDHTTMYRWVQAYASTGRTIDFMLSAKRGAKAAKRLFRKMLIAATSISTSDQRRPE